MPITKSAKKSLRQSVKRKDRNLTKKKAIKSSIKEIKKRVEKGDRKGAEELLPKFYKTVDKAAKTGFIKNNNASRKKSRVTKAVNRKS